MNRESISIHEMTRSEYYKYMGLSGSVIDRPDDKVDENFIKHVTSLKLAMDNMINSFKLGESVFMLE